MTKIFISYRRDDSGFAADRVHEAALDFVDDPSDVFMDIDGIPPGVDFVDHINQKVGQCDVLFALIGRDWLSIRDHETGRRRLDDPGDFVRAEVAAALARNIPVVPILLGGVEMPQAEDLPDDLKPLARRNAVALGRQSFKHDITMLMAGLGLSEKPARKGGGAVLGWLAGLALVGVVAVGAFFLVPMFIFEPAAPTQPVGVSATVETPAPGQETRTRRLGINIVQNGQARGLEPVLLSDGLLTQTNVRLARGPFQLRFPGSHWSDASTDWPLVKVVVSNDPALFADLEPNETLEDASPFFWACSYAPYEFGSPELLTTRMGDGPGGVACGNNAYGRNQLQEVSADARTLTVGSIIDPDDAGAADLIQSADRLYMIVYITKRPETDDFEAGARHEVSYGEVEFLELVFD